MLNKDKAILISADGGARNNGKPNAIGGWGFVIVQDGQAITHGYGSESDLDTNNKNEIKSLTIALNRIMELNVSLDHSLVVQMDSSYVLNCFNDKWYINWIKNGWKNAKKKPVENKDLWLDLIELALQFENLSFHKVKGHSGDKWNELADRYANLAMDEAELKLQETPVAKVESEIDLLAAIRAEKLKY